MIKQFQFWFGCVLLACTAVHAEDSLTVTVTIDRGHDVGQAFGTLFESTSDDGTLAIGAGFQNCYNTRLRGDRHDLQLYIRSKSGEREHKVEPLPRPNELCGTYLYSRDGVVSSTYGGVRTWDSKAGRWIDGVSTGGTEETMRVGKGLLEFGDSWVKYEGNLILGPPSKGSYQLFYYANGYLCFYHVNRGEGGYRPFQNDIDGFSRLYACPWTTQESTVDLSRAVALTLPVVGETTFAWGQLGPKIVTGSNVGGFYTLENGSWQTLLPPKLGVSNQLYSTTAFHDSLLMGQYPTGRVFEYDGLKIFDHNGWPPKLDAVSGSAREAQTTVIYGGELFVGVWPWAELWRYNPDSQKWFFVQRMIDHPKPSDSITHPYDVENLGHEVGNLWGQRVTSLVPNGPDLIISTSAKHPCEWDATRFPFLAPDKWKSYGSVHRLTLPGHLSANVMWTTGSTTLEFALRGASLSISQDGKKIAETIVENPLAERLRAIKRIENIRWGEGIFGKFSGQKLDGSISNQLSAGK
jgi:hypothetical protein